MTDISEEELRQLNAYTRRALGAEEVYVFSVTLCDNEVDRDFERFSVPALSALAKLFLGKTGIFDHSRDAGGQTARIFKTWVEEDKTRVTTQGEPYTMLRAKAYMVRTDDNRSLIEEIDGGIKKEVSVGCSIGKATCSICGAQRRTPGCEHRLGKRYGERMCHLILDEPTDAYEWSFVAVPAQREAGVTKAFVETDTRQNGTLRRIKSAHAGLQLSAEDVRTLKARLRALEHAESDAEAFREALLAEIEKHLLRALPQVKTGRFLENCRTMETHALQELCETLKAQTAGDLPPTPQLARAVPPRTDPAENQAFRI